MKIKTLDRMRNQIHKKKDKKKKHRRRVRIEDSDSSDSWIWFLLFFAKFIRPISQPPLLISFCFSFYKKTYPALNTPTFFVPNVQK